MEFPGLAGRGASSTAGGSLEASSTDFAWGGASGLDIHTLPTWTRVRSADQALRW